VTRLLDEKRWISGRFFGWREAAFFKEAFVDVKGTVVEDHVVRQVLAVGGPALAASLSILSSA